MATTDTERCDLHILACLARPDWLEAAIASTDGQPVNLFVCEGEDGHIGRARAQAFQHGSAEYVAWIDDDDVLEPGAVAMCIEYLDQHPQAVSVYTDVIVIDEAGAELHRTAKAPWTPVRQLCRVGEVHHFHMARRAWVEEVLPKLAQWACGCEEYVLMGELARFGPHHHISAPLYRWRQKSGPSALRTITEERWRAAIAQVRPILLGAHRRGLRQV